jgi:hypothetical protein
MAGPAAKRAAVAHLQVVMDAAAYNLVRLPKLIAEASWWPSGSASPRPLPAAGASSKWTSGYDCERG